MADQGTGILGKLNAALGAVAVAVGVWAQFEARDASREAEEAKAVADASRLDLERRGYELAVFNVAYEALGSTNARQQTAAIKLVESLDEESPVRRGLLGVFGVSGTPEAKARVERIYTEEEAFRKSATRVEKVAQTGNLLVDIFHCVDAAGNAPMRPMARRLDELLRAQARSGSLEAIRTIRVRPLPQSVNARPGYRVVSNEVRYDTKDELNVAQALIAEARNIGLSLGTHEATWSKGSPNYVSVFLCDSGSGAAVVESPAVGE